MQNLAAVCEFGEASLAAAAAYDVLLDVRVGWPAARIDEVLGANLLRLPARRGAG